MRPEVIVFIAFLIVYFLGTEGARRYIDAKVQALLATGLYDEAFEELNHLWSRILLSTFKQHEYRYLVHQARGERELAERMLELLVRMRNSSKRQVEATTLAFNHYAQAGNRSRAKELLHDLKRIKGVDQAVVADCQLTYDIVCGKRHDMIKQMESRLPSAEGPLKGKLLFLLARQYANAGDKVRARDYQARFDELMATQAPAPSTR